MDPDEETTGAEYEFLELPPWKRILIVVAGPLMNFVLAFLIYVFLLGVYGKPYTATTTIGMVPEGFWGWEMGLRDGDTILRVNNQEITTWDEFEQQLYWDQYQDPKTNQVLQDKISMLIERGGEKIYKEKALPKDLFNQPIDANQASFQRPESFQGILVTNVLEGGPAQKAGVKPGMIISEADGNAFTTRNDWANYFASRYEQQADGSFAPVPMKVTVAEPNSATQTLTIIPEIEIPDADALPFHPKTKISLVFDGEISVKDFFVPGTPILGISPKIPPVVGNLFKRGPADEAGLTPNSKIVELDGQPIDDWYKVLLAIQDSLYQDETGVDKAKPIALTWLTPDDQMMSGTITPEVVYKNLPTPTSIQTGKRYAIAQIGIDQKADREKLGILGSIVGGWEKTVYVSGYMVSFLAQSFSGDVSPRLLGGPVAIFSLSAETGRWGLERFFSFIALLSANLGLINLFPIPPLDGGHVAFYTYEMIRRKPLTMKQMERFAKVGFAVIIPLILLVLFNDLYNFEFFSWIAGFFK